jgi:hypothetical protein
MPPHEPVYQYQFAFEPDIPPEILNVEEEPEQIERGEPDADEAGAEFVFKVMVMLAQEVVFIIPSALTKYIVVEEGITVKDVPVVSYVPPHEPEYQYHAAPVPRLPPVKLNEEEKPSQIID